MSAEQLEVVRLAPDQTVHGGRQSLQLVVAVK